MRNSFKPFDSGADFDGVVLAIRDLDAARALVLDPALAEACRR